ncbi:hypothetical protein RUM43_007914 [Polyplax serrata]|uniref:Uncharacterized protein n=1 Tax=Polyplax serrata TaxID=468196 RepID=A0AAN8PE17_POLSC
MLGSKTQDEVLSHGKTIISNLLAGATAGGLAKSAIAPFDRCKISFQINQTPFSAKAAFQFLKNVTKNNGFLALWRGNSASMARVLPYAAIQFASHEQWKRVLGIDQSNSLSKDEFEYRRFIAGSLAGVTSQSLTYPLDLARARMAVTHDSEYATLKQVFRKTYREEGFKGFYRGYVPTFLGVIPYAGASFFAYESLKQWYSSQPGSTGKPSTIVLLSFGGISGFCGQSLSYPLDIVRRRMQTDVITKQNYDSIIGTLKSIYKNEGIKGGFFKGLSMNWIKGPIAVGISFATYDGVNDFLKRILSRI